MADGAFQWVFDLIDKVSGPAKTMDNRLKELGEHVEKLQKQFTALASVEAFKIAYEGAEKLIDIVKELGLEALKAADFERTALLSFSALTGSRESGEGLLRMSKMLADKAGVDRKAVMTQFAGLRMAGFTDPTAMGKIVAAAYDVQNKSMGATSAQSVTGLFSTIMQRGQFDSRMLRGMDGMGISAKEFGKQLGYSVKTLDQLREKMGGKSFEGVRAMEALMKAFAGPGQQVGGLTKDIGDGWEGSVKKLQNAWDSVLESVGETSAFTNIIDIVKSLTAALDPATVSGKRIRQIFTDAADAVGDMLAPLKTKDGMKGFLDGLETAKNAMLTILQTTLDLMALIGKGFSNQFVEDKMAAPTRNWLKRAGASVMSMPDALFGMSDAQKRMFQAGGDNGLALGAGFKKATRTNSPSLMFRDFGQFAAEGFGMGFQGNLSSPIKSGVGEMTKAAGGKTAVNFTINASSSEARGIGERARDVVLSALAASFEELAVESGVS